MSRESIQPTLTSCLFSDLQVPQNNQPGQKRQRTPPPSQFQHLGPSRNRYTILHDEFQLEKVSQSFLRLCLSNFFLAAILFFCFQSSTSSFVFETFWERIPQFKSFLIIENWHCCYLFGETQDVDSKDKKFQVFYHHHHSELKVKQISSNCDPAKVDVSWRQVFVPEIKQFSLIFGSPRTMILRNFYFEIKVMSEKSFELKVCWS